MKNSAELRKEIIADAIATVLINNHNEREALCSAKVEALMRTQGLVEYYATRNFDKKLLDKIVEKKAHLILQATTVQDVKELSRQPKPYYDGNKFVDAKNSVPEEELICWSLTSLKAPLTQAATERFLELAAQFYGEDAIRGKL